MRTITLIMAAVLVLAIAAAGVGALMARHYYFRAKLAAAEPVALWVYADENAALLKHDAERGRLRPRVLLIGDSRVRAMHLTTVEQKSEVLNRGINGETSAQMLLRFGNDALALKPDVIVIQSGMNDLVAGIGADTLAPVITTRTIENLKLAAGRAAAAGSKVVVLTVIPPARPNMARRFVWNDSVRNEVVAVNAELLAWKPPNGVRVLDLSQVFGSPTLLPAEFALDTLHLNGAAYTRLDGKLSSFISSLCN